ncbi:MAG: tetratricopeptide repeat-containing diguanylate cyclase [Nitriliruptoraceae bacterium]
MSPSPAVADRFQRAWRRRRHDVIGALEEAESLRDEATVHGDDHGLGRALTLIGACHLTRNDHAAAVRALLEARALLTEAPAEDRARVLAEAGYLDVLLGEASEGLARLLEAVELYEGLADAGGQAFVLNRIGITFYDGGHLDDAEHAYDRALALCGDGDQLLVAGIHNNLAKVATARDEHERALEHLRAARAFFEEIGELRGLGMTFHNAAVVSEAQERAERATAQYRRSIELYEAAAHLHGACEARTRLGLLRLRVGATDDAAALLERSHADAERLGIDRERARAAEGLSELHEVRGELDLALAWCRHVRTLERSLFDRDSEERLRTLQVRFQLERLERDSVTDPLTGVLNRRGLEQRLNGGIDHAREMGEPLAVLVLDLDDFKLVNDRFSHSVGDEVLRVVGELLRARSRARDAIARVGGEEFVAVLPGCSEDGAVLVAEELCAAIRDHDWETIQPGLQVTTSAGIAVLDAEMPAASLLAEADRSLYGAKGEGKDRVHGGRSTTPGRRPQTT